MRFKSSAHAVYNVQYHIVWTPRYRKKLLSGGVGKYAKKVLENLQGLHGDIEVKKVNVQPDHVHLIIVIPPRVSVADVVKYMKSRTGKILNERFGHIKQAMQGEEGMWSRGYCVSSIGLNEKIIMRYVEHQEKKDKGQLKLKLG